jgi:leader peptidase (prepilin peptidase)/N-methyltransferase
MDADLALTLLNLLPLLFFTCVGCCIGSLINVLVYRMPLGLDVVVPSSACPKCQTKLSWRDNIPVLGWLALRGRCRYCATPISAEYPIVEAITGLLFALTWAVCYLIPSNASLWGFHLIELTPDWARSGWQVTWPIYLVIVGLFSCLLAMTIIDARTFMIPLALPFAAAVIGLVGHMGAVGYVHLVGRTQLPITAQGWLWSMATPTPTMFFGSWWWWIGASIGACVGLGTGMLLLRLGLIRRSFADYDAWEKQQLAQQGAGAPADGASSDGVATAARPDDPTVLWTAYPHARREMIKEAAFLAPAGVLGALGGWLALRLTAAPALSPEALKDLPPGVDPDSVMVFAGGAVPPLWLIVLGGVLMGYLIGGGIVWAVRILGTLAFGKEAMGLGDVHLMAGVGACLGWLDATLAFFLSAFVAMAYTVLGLVGGGRLRKTMPYGPWLALASVLVFFGKPVAEWGISRLLKAAEPISLP